ncbi:MAG: hypothetical protein BWY56_00288 [Acidobacteria bacterium ADurb.Bin340]|nr:MAG: hypothetical protein BWY56_00288 [Acidobacteria bacterium ADurb.Bin340]
MHPGGMNGTLPILLLLVALPLKSQAASLEPDWRTVRVLPPWFVYEVPVAGDPQKPLRLRKGAGPRGIPEATVEVVATAERARQERFEMLQVELAPLVTRAFQIGASSPFTGEMLSEFMSMTADSLRPPTVPAVFYNATVPYWVQQGWDGPLAGLGYQRSIWSWGLSSQIHDPHRPLIPGPVKR